MSGNIRHLPSLTLAQAQQALDQPRRERAPQEDTTPCPPTWREYRESLPCTLTREALVSALAEAERDLLPASTTQIVRRLKALSLTLRCPFPDPASTDPASAEGQELANMALALYVAAVADVPARVWDTGVVAFLRQWPRRYGFPAPADLIAVFADQTADLRARRDELYRHSQDEETLAILAEAEARSERNRKALAAKRDAERAELSKVMEPPS